MNARMQDTVWQIARGEKKPSLDLLRAQFDETRAPS